MKLYHKSAEGGTFKNCSGVVGSRVKYIIFYNRVQSYLVDLGRMPSCNVKRCQVDIRELKLGKKALRQLPRIKLCFCKVSGYSSILLHPRCQRLFVQELYQALIMR